MALSVSPTEVEFETTPVGPECPGTNCTYELVTIVNNGTETEQLQEARAEYPGWEGQDIRLFWPTFGGTLNTPNGYLLPPGESATFQWGFHPQEPGMATGSGWILFHSGEKLTIQLKGRGTPEKGHKGP
jgi:hypothetical protein